MSIRDAAFSIAAYAARSTPSIVPTKVTTVRLVAAPASTSSSRTPSTARIADSMASRMPRSRPSLKFGTHSTSLIPSPSRKRMTRSTGRRLGDQHHDARVVVEPGPTSQRGDLGVAEEPGQRQMREGVADVGRVDVGQAVEPPPARAAVEVESDVGPSRQGDALL